MLATTGSIKPFKRKKRNNLDYYQRTLSWRELASTAALERVCVQRATVKQVSVHMSTSNIMSKKRVGRNMNGDRKPTTSERIKWDSGRTRGRPSSHDNSTWVEKMFFATCVDSSHRRHWLGPDSWLRAVSQKKGASNSGVCVCVCVHMHVKVCVLHA